MQTPFFSFNRHSLILVGLVAFGCSESAYPNQVSIAALGESAAPSSSSVSLEVEVMTDFVPGQDFEKVVVVVDDTTSHECQVSPGDDFQSGVLLFFLELPSQNARHVELKLMDEHGNQVASSVRIFNHQSNRRMRFVVQAFDRSCQNECEPGETCIDGVCAVPC